MLDNMPPEMYRKILEIERDTRRPSRNRHADRTVGHDGHRFVRPARRRPGRR